MAVTVVLTPVLQKAEKCRFYQEIGGCYKGTIILKNPVPIRNIPFKCILYVLKKHLCEERNEREIRLALYIRLEYSLLPRAITLTENEILNIIFPNIFEITCDTINSPALLISDFN